MSTHRGLKKAISDSGNLADMMRELRRGTMGVSFGLTELKKELDLLTAKTDIFGKITKGNVGDLQSLGLAFDEIQATMGTVDWRLEQYQTGMAKGSKAARWGYASQRKFQKELMDVSEAITLEYERLVPLNLQMTQLREKSFVLLAPMFGLQNLSQLVAKGFKSIFTEGTWVSDLFEDIAWACEDIGLAAEELLVPGLEVIVNLIEAVVPWVQAFTDAFLLIPEPFRTFISLLLLAGIALFPLGSLITNVTVALIGFQIGMLMVQQVGLKGYLEMLFQPFITLAQAIWGAIAAIYAKIAALGHWISAQLAAGIAGTSLTGVMVLLASSILAVVGGFLIGYSLARTFISAFGPMGAVIIPLIGIVWSLTAAVLALYGVISWGTAIPLLLGGIAAAVGGVVAAAGVSMPIPHMQEGGIITGGGLAMVDTGEEVRPAEVVKRKTTEVPPSINLNFYGPVTNKEWISQELEPEISKIIDRKYKRSR